ncbi:MAG: hypothetical protein KIT09_21695 [Bryobacteraceae bacterium]|nr:hypothetical protein [Bryobacteraceae bacterium]
MMRKYIVGTAVATILTAGIAAIVGFVLASVHAASDKLVAFTVQEIKSVYRPDGSVGMRMESTMAVREDGSRATVSAVQAPDGAWRELRSITDTIAGRKTDVDGITESTTTYELTAGELAQARNAARACSEAGGERGRALGFEVVKITEDLAQGSLARIENWLAPELDCYALRSKAYVRSADGSLRLTQEMQARWVQVGAPDESLFAIPANYTERSPSAVARELERRFPGLACADCPANPADAAYQERRQ